MVKRVPWLSVTPEPERELPEAGTALRCGTTATAEPAAEGSARRAAARGEDRAGQAGGERRAAERRAVRARVRRPGLDDARVVPGQRAVRAGDGRPALARAERLQRAHSGHARADRALPDPRPAR